MFQIVTDTSANLPWSYVQEHGITVVPFSYHVDDVEHTESAGDFDGHAFYQAIRDGARPTTSQIPPQRYVEYLTPLLQKGDDVLLLSMSSGISGSCHSAHIAAEELLETFPQRKVVVIDTLAASLGEGLQVMEAVDLRAGGMDLDTVAATITRRRENIYQQLMVDDLMYLRRTGRVSGASAVVGSLLSIKPILKGSPEGLLVVSAKIRGRKHAIQEMARRYAELVRDPGNQRVGIAHTDCPEDAKYLAELIRAAHEPMELVEIVYEPVTGAHAGPDALALFFYGDTGIRNYG